MNTLKCGYLFPFACCALLIVATSAMAAFPDRPIRVIVTMPTGGGADTVARIVSLKVAEKLGQPVIVENKPGADGSIGAEVVARSAPDGYTLAWITNAHVVSPFYVPLTYNAETSFAPITQVAEAPDVLVVPATFGASTAQELVALAKARPGELNYATPGVNTPSSLEMVSLMNLTNTKMLGVPFKGGSEAMVALVNGTVQIYIGAISTILPYVTSGRAKALAVTSKARSTKLPNVPTVAEALNLPGFEGGIWQGVLAPAGVPKDIVLKLNDTFVEAINAPDVRDRILSLGWTPIANTSDAFASVIKSDIVRWGEVFKSMDRK